MKDERKEFERETVANVTNPFSCNNCDFVGKNKAGLSKHEKSKHVKNSKNRNTSTSEIIQKQSESDEFTTKVNDFLKAVNYLNNSENSHSCAKCSETFGSKEFLEIHIVAAHKISVKLVSLKQAIRITWKNAFLSQEYGIRKKLN